MFIDNHFNKHSYIDIYMDPQTLIFLHILLLKCTLTKATIYIPFRYIYTPTYLRTYVHTYKNMIMYIARNTTACATVTNR